MNQFIRDVSDVAPAIHFPAPGVIGVVCPTLFAEPDAQFCRRFLGRALLAREIEMAEIAPSSPSVDLRFDPARHSRKALLNRLADLLSRATPLGEGLVVAPTSTARDRHGVVRFRRWRTG
jgi:hypothetical protein